MKKLIRLVIKTSLILFVLFIAVSIQIMAEAFLRAKLGALEMFILFGGAAAAIRAIYKFEGKSSNTPKETKLDKDLQ